MFKLDDLLMNNFDKKGSRTHLVIHQLAQTNGMKTVTVFGYLTLRWLPTVLPSVLHSKGNVSVFQYLLHQHEYKKQN